MLISIASVSARINRYIVGCKYKVNEIVEINDLGINRYIVGCKLLHTRGRQYSAYELIDTQWDVNTTGTDSNKSLAAGINRYIVGCKFG